MSKNSEGRIVRRKIGEIPRSTPEDLAGMRAMQDRPVDTSDILQQAYDNRIVRDADGKLPRQDGMIHQAVIQAMTTQGMTTYALWKSAKVHSSTITETAVGDFLKGRRSIGIDDLDAILRALKLEIHNAEKATAPD